MAFSFTLSELRTELRALGHDGLPDHVILGFLSQLDLPLAPPPHPVNLSSMPMTSPPSSSSASSSSSSSFSARNTETSSSSSSACSVYSPCSDSSSSLRNGTFLMDSPLPAPNGCCLKQPTATFGSSKKIPRSRMPPTEAISIEERAERSDSKESSRFHDAEGERVDYSKFSSSSSILSAYVSSQEKRQEGGRRSYREKVIERYWTSLGDNYITSLHREDLSVSQKQTSFGHGKIRDQLSPFRICATQKAHESDKNGNMKEKARDCKGKLLRLPLNKNPWLSDKPTKDDGAFRNRKQDLSDQLQESPSTIPYSQPISEGSDNASSIVSTSVIQEVSGEFRMNSAVDVAECPFDGDAAIHVTGRANATEASTATGNQKLDPKITASIEALSAMDAQPLLHRNPKLAQLVPVLKTEEVVSAESALPFASTTYSRKQPSLDRQQADHESIEVNMIGDTTSSSVSEHIETEAIHHVEKKPFAKQESEGGQNPKSPEAAADSKDSSIRPSKETTPKKQHQKQMMKRGGKIDRVARIAEMQKLWRKDSFLAAIDRGGKRKGMPSFHQLFSTFHNNPSR